MGAVCCNTQIAFPCLPKIHFRRPELLDRIWFIFRTNLHHLIPVFIAGAACFIPCLIPGGLTFTVGLVTCAGALATAISYYSYKLIDSWGLYPYDFIDKIPTTSNLVERKEVIDRVLDYLSKPDENNVLIVGEAGTGKTTLAHALAKSAPKGFEVYRLKIDKLFAVDQPFGHFEKRFLEVVEVLKHKKAILFVDEAHRLFHSGSGSPLSDRLKPYHSLRIVGVTTPKEYAKYFEDDPFVERFNLYKLDPMDDATTKLVLKKKFPSLPEPVLQNLIECSKKLFPNRAQPRAAIQFAINVLHKSRGKAVTLDTINETFSFEKSSLKDL